MSPKNEIEELIESDVKELTPDFFKKNQKTIDRVKDKVNDQINRFEKKSGRNSNYNSLNDLISIISRLSSDNANINSKNLNSVPDGKEYTGIRHISDINSNNDIVIAEELLEELYQIFDIMPQYLQIVELIPDIENNIDIINRDIRNPGELNPRTIERILLNYPVEDSSMGDLEELDSELIQKIPEEYKLEEKIKNWIKEAMIKGAKPIGVFSYPDLLKSISIFNKNNNISGESINSFEGLLNEYYKSNGDIYNIILESFDRLNELTTEDINPLYENSLETMSTSEEQAFYEKILPKSLLDSWMNNSTEEITNFFDTQMTSGFYSSEEYDEIIESKNNYLKSIEELNKDEKYSMKYQKLREKMKPLIDIVNKNFKIVDPELVSLLEARKVIEKKMRLEKKNNEFANDDELKVFMVNQTDQNMDNKKNINKNELEDSFIEKLSIKNDSIIIEYDPENVIPIRYKTQHFGYYIIEELDGIGNPSQLNKRKMKSSSSFLELIRDLGLNDDTKFSEGNNFANPMDNHFFDPLNSVYGNNFAMQNSNSSQKQELIQNIIINTINSRIKDIDLQNDKVFRDFVIKNIYKIFTNNKQIQLTYIPENKMVYYHLSLDSQGLPQSIMKGTLFYSYLYLSSILTNHMIKLAKSENKEKLTLDIGRSKQIGTTIAEIERLTTQRNTKVGTMFNGITSIFKNAGAFQRFIIPKVGGEALYEMEEMAVMNDYDIDDEYTNNLLFAIINKIGRPPAAVELGREVEFSRQIIAQHIQYKNLIVDYQKIFNNHNTKLIKILVKNSKLIESHIISNTPTNVRLTKKELKEKTDIIKSYISIKYDPPMFLNISSTSETIGIVEEYVDKITTIIFGDFTDTDIDKNAMHLFKKKLFKTLLNNVDWTDIYNSLENSYKEAEESTKHRAIRAAKDEKLKEVGGDDDDSGGGGGGW